MGGRSTLATTHSPLIEASRLPSRPGTYVFFLQVGRSLTQKVGRLGRFHFPAGIYAYVGSARGAGGLAARLRHHLRPPTSPHWHIDYLRPAAQPVAIWWVEGEGRRECAWARALAQMEGASLPVPRFGASDCRCPAHLVHFPELPSRKQFERIVGEAVQAGVIDQLQRARRMQRRAA